jgi:hypothetical protein
LAGPVGTASFRRRCAFGAVMSLWAAAFLFPVIARDIVPPPGEDPVLTEILENTRIYCQKLDDYAFHFVCTESVSERLVGTPKLRWSPGSLAGATNQNPGVAPGQTMRVTDANTENSYLYRYELIRKQGENREKRTLLEKNRQRTVVPHARLEAMRFHFETMTFGPIDVFGVVGRLRHEYRVVGRDTIKGERVIIVEALSTADTIDYNPGGKVWIREGDNAILKIEWDPTTLPEYKDIKTAADAMNETPVFTLVTEYGVDKDGFRFPSRFFIREAYLKAKTGKTEIVSEVTIEYKNYRFHRIEPGPVEDKELES